MSCNKKIKNATLLSISIPILFLVLSLSAAKADKIYTYTDAEGQSVISTTPPPNHIKNYASDVNIAALEKSAGTSNQAQKSLYQYTDKAGVVHFSDTPRAQSVKIADFTAELLRPAMAYGRSSDGAVNPFEGIDVFNASFDYKTEVNKKGFGSKATHFDPLIQKYAVKFNVDPLLIHAVIRTESAYNPVAVSSAGAVGLMQLMPAAAERFGVTDRLSPEQSIRAGSQYLRKLINLFEGNILLALAAYNAGESTIIAQDYQIPNYPETRQYVIKVMEHYAAYQAAE